MNEDFEPPGQGPVARGQVEGRHVSGHCDVPLTNCFIDGVGNTNVYRYRRDKVLYMKGYAIIPCFVTFSFLRSQSFSRFFEDQQ